MGHTWQYVNVRGGPTDALRTIPLFPSCNMASSISAQRKACSEARNPHVPPPSTKLAHSSKRHHAAAITGGIATSYAPGEGRSSKPIGGRAQGEGDVN
jgi:hypothetical protein